MVARMGPQILGPARSPREKEQCAGRRRNWLVEAEREQETPSALYQEPEYPSPEPIVTIESDTRGYWTWVDLDDSDG